MFPDNKIHIFATSWGSILSARVLEKSENMVNGVVACGQIIKEVKGNAADIPKHQEIYGRLLQ